MVKGFYKKIIVFALLAGGLGVCAAEEPLSTSAQETSIGDLKASIGEVVGAAEDIALRIAVNLPVTPTVIVAGILMTAGTLQAAHFLWDKIRRGHSMQQWTFSELIGFWGCVASGTFILAPFIKAFIAANAGNLKIVKAISWSVA